LIIGDVGQERVEEIDFVRNGAGRGRGANFGWRCYEGTERTADVDPCEPPGHVLPALTYENPPDSCRAVTGGYVVRDPDLESLFGRYVYGDYCTGEVRSTILRSRGAEDDELLGLFPRFNLSSFGQDATGRIYLTALNEGRVYRLTD
jgi:hypothetical protein